MPPRSAFSGIYLTNVLFQSTQRAGSWNEDHRRHIVASARALIDFQRRHHELENRRLFPEIARRSSDSAKAELAAALESFDADVMHGARSNRALALATELTRTYTPDRSAQTRYDSAQEHATRGDAHVRSECQNSMQNSTSPFGSTRCETAGRMTARPPASTRVRCSPSPSCSMKSREPLDTSSSAHTPGFVSCCRSRPSGIRPLRNAGVLR
jgi:hypothetical protein